jgi:NADH dehydrogenase/NADH:ubiquinone oxidoreductase subunit G
VAVVDLDVVFASDDFEFVDCVEVALEISGCGNCVSLCFYHCSSFIVS